MHGSDTEIICKGVILGSGVGSLPAVRPVHS